MKLTPKHVPFVAAVLLAAAMARAESGYGQAGQFVYGKIGSTGGSIGLGRAIDDRFAVRLGVGGGARYTHDKTLSGVAYDIKDKPLAMLEALADWYPLAGSGFRLTGGLVVSNARADLTGKKDGAGNFSLNDHSYSAAAVGDLKGTMKFNSVAPYLGIGWESDRPASKGWRFVGDAGLVYLGKGRARLSAAGSAGDAALRQDVEAERRQLADEFRHTLGLVVSAGATYAF